MHKLYDINEVIILENEPQLFPGNWGMLCPGNGVFKDKHGNPIECLCDECDYLVCCSTQSDCDTCTVADCPRSYQQKHK